MPHAGDHGKPAYPLRSPRTPLPNAAVAMLAAAAAAVAAELRSDDGRARLLRLTALTLPC
jgi:hypothetical protein